METPTTHRTQLSTPLWSQILVRFIPATGSDAESDSHKLGAELAQNVIPYLIRALCPVDAHNEVSEATWDLIARTDEAGISGNSLSFDVWGPSLTNRSHRFSADFRPQIGAAFTPRLHGDPEYHVDELSRYTEPHDTSLTLRGNRPWLNKTVALHWKIWRTIHTRIRVILPPPSGSTHFANRTEVTALLLQRALPKLFACYSRPEDSHLEAGLWSRAAGLGRDHFTRPTLSPVNSWSSSDWQNDTRSGRPPSQVFLRSDSTIVPDNSQVPCFVVYLGGNVSPLKGWRNDNTVYFLVDYQIAPVSTWRVSAQLVSGHSPEQHLLINISPSPRPGIQNAHRMHADALVILKAAYPPPEEQSLFATASHTPLLHHPSQHSRSPSNQSNLSDRTLVGSSGGSVSSGSGENDSLGGSFGFGSSHGTSARQCAMMHLPIRAGKWQVYKMWRKRVKDEKL